MVRWHRKERKKRVYAGLYIAGTVTDLVVLVDPAGPVAVCVIV